ncbi:MAG: SUMF1/EgtB/PvdO family nonheme iron enzyme, partial [Planctomycetaceae bacterium]|nr:SUMF1/EgtB/PvdO family nonheme iron enzyme [Planctomycetaceae bacterium]
WDPAFYGKFEEDAAINPFIPFSAGSQRVIRGGDWYYNTSRCRSSSRGDDRPTTRRAHIGFRVVLVVDAVKASKPDYSLEYDGVTSYSVTPTLQIQENQPWTIEGWVTALGRPLQKNHAVFILNPRINLALTHGSESGSYWSGLSNPKADQSANRFHSSDQFATFNKETHLALVNDGKSVRFFVDGVLQQSVIEAELSNELGHLNIGPPNPKAHTGMAGFRGRLDEVRISQVARYQQNFQPERRFEPDEQTLALYHFDEGEGDVLNDSSGNGHHGQIVGASWVRADRSQIEPLSKQTEWHGWPADAPPPAIAPFDAAQARKHQEEWAKYLGVPVEYENSIGMKFRLIPPGEFLMGSTPEEIEAALKQFPDKPEEQLWIQSEGPQHRVVLTQPFYLGLTELTQSQYFQIKGANPSAHSPTGVKKDLVADMDTGNLPVELITWGMATDFCQTLSEQEKLSSCYLRTDGNCELVEGTGYRMPTEAQWEFACRAGTITRFWSGENDSELTAVEHTSDSSLQVTREVGTSKANPFGLFEMLGNVHEWIEDGAVLDAPHTSGPGVAVDPFHPFSGIEHRIFRGGNNFRRLHDCRAGARHCYSRHVGTAGIGVRIALTVEAVRSLI